MGFGFRKSFGSGPFRFTVSPRGVSSSFGVRGARITAGPRGTFVTISSHGVYYLHRIDAPSPQQPSPAKPAQQYEPPPLDPVFQVPLTELVASNQTDLVARLSADAAATNPAFIPFAPSCLAIFTMQISPMVAAILVVAGLLLTITVARRFTATHTQEIHYALDASATERYAAIQRALSTLASCNRIWVLNTSSSTSDFKRNAGAATLITRSSASIGAIPTKGFKASLPISSIGANGTIFHFLPDQILLFSGNRYASIQYPQLFLEVRATRYIESESIPGDSRQVDTTGRFVNKNGGPDRRFNNNRQIPILQYGEVTIRTGAGLQVILQTSSIEKSQTFVAQYHGVWNSGPASSGTQESRTAQSGSWKPGPTEPGPGNDPLSECYDLLGLTRPATGEQAAAAYHQKASLYHPERRIPHRLTFDLDRYTSLTASADGRRLAVTRASPRRTLWRLRIDDSTTNASEAAQVPLTTSTGFSPRLGPDYLLYVSATGTGEGIWKFTNGTATELWNGQGAQVLGGPAIARDGRHIAFSVRQLGQTLLCAMQDDGTNAHIVTDSLDLQGDPAWAPDGQSIATAANDHGVSHLFRVPLDGRAAAPFFVRESSVDPAWAPDGQFVIYSGPDIGTTFSVKAVSAEATPHPMPPLTLTLGARHLAFLPGGRTLVVLRGEIQHKILWLIDLETGAERQLTNLPPDFDIRDFDISPNGREVVLERMQERSDVVLLDIPRS